MLEGFEMFKGVNPFTIILAGWPIAFLWLMRYTIIQGFKREQKLIEVNQGWQKSFDKLSDSIDRMSDTFALMAEANVTRRNRMTKSSRAKNEQETDTKDA